MYWIDPDCLPETSGVVDCVLQNAAGEADGLVLTDGTEIHFPPHMGGDVVSAVRPGGTIRVRGVRPRRAAMVAAVALEAEDGSRIIDAGPPKRDGSGKPDASARIPMEAKGVLRQVLHGPKGEVRGVLLEDGRAGRFAPHAAAAWASRLAPGTAILMRGKGIVTAHGTVIAVAKIESAP